MFHRYLLLLLTAVAGFSADVSDSADYGPGPLPAGATIWSGGTVPTSGQMLYSNGTSAAGAPEHTWDTTNKTVILNKNVVALPAPATAADTLLHVGNADGQSARILIDAWGSGFAPVYTGRFARNIASNPQAVQAGDALATLNAIGYGATGYGTAANAAFYLGANETWTDATHSTKAILELTVSGSIARSVVWTYLPTSTTVLNTDTATNAVSGTFVLNHATTGTPAIGYGESFTMQGMDDGASTQRLMAAFAASWTDAATATRSSKLNINISANAVQLSAVQIAPTNTVITGSDAVTAAATTIFTIAHQTTGTAANGFGTAFVLNGPDDGGTLRGMGTITASWTTAASASRASKLTFAVQVAAVSTVGFTLNATNATYASGFPIIESDTTDGTSGSAGAISTLGGIGVTKAGWFGGIVTANGATAAATQPTFVASGTSTIAGGVTDGYTTSIRLTPVYSGAFTVTRHNYIDLNQITGASTITDAAVFRFDAAAGTHKATAAGTTKTTPGTVNAWVKININGTLFFIPAYTSTTSMASPIERAVRATISLPTEPDDQVSYVRAQEAA